MKFLDSIKSLFNSAVTYVCDLFSPSTSSAQNDTSRKSSANMKPPVARVNAPAAPTPPPAPQKKTEVHHVAGESYRLEDLLALMFKNDYYTYSKKDLVDYGIIDERVYKYEIYTGVAELVPEPENPHDPQAIKVIVDSTHIGYIKAGSCARVHKLLREDSIEKVEVEIKGGEYKIVTEEYDDEADKFTYDIERGETTVQAVLTLTLK